MLTSKECAEKIDELNYMIRCVESMGGEIAVCKPHFERMRAAYNLELINAVNREAEEAYK